MNETPIPSRSQSLVALHTAVLLFGFAGLFGKWLTLSPVLIVLGRTVVATMVLLAISRRLHLPRRPFELRLLGNGAVLALHWVTFFAAIQASSVTIGLLGYASFPVFTLLLERILLRRQWNGRDAAISLLVVAGLALLVPGWSFDNTTVQGLAWGMVSAFAFALLAVMNRAYTVRRAAIDLALWQNAAAALCLLPFAFPALSLSGLPGARELIAILVLGVLCTALAHTLFIFSLRAITAHAASVIAALEPAYGIVLAWWLLAEAPTLRTWIGAALLVGAAVVVARRPALRVVAPHGLG